MTFEEYLRVLASNDGSDLYLSTGAPPCAKFQGILKPLASESMRPGEIAAIADAILDDEQRRQFAQELEMNLAISVPSVGRFRINIFRQRNEVSIVARNITIDIPRFDDLGLPPVLKEVVMSKRGLILFVGGTGSGKSTSLAALIDHRNSTSGGHIITIEDPIEYVHRHKKCIVNQREVGVDTRSFQSALVNTLRQAPDVILIGEVRNRETMEHALAFAETGHLAISTLHANNANQALERIVNLFPEERRAQLLMNLGQNLRAFVSQRLVRTVDGKRCAAVEVLLGTKTIEELVIKGEFDSIKEIMAKSEALGMQTFDSALFSLYKQGRISDEEAIRNADSQNDVRLRIKLDRSGGDLSRHSDPVSPATPASRSAPGPGGGFKLELEMLDDEQTGG
ncbi:MAG: PilT/PilU family type 4a pilus ATPase [Pseudomonadales bacterium]|nr:PilT/PilU family type 4a pilus ATPase [Pseudomonadales bacterium]